MNRYQPLVGKLNYGVFLIFVALLPFPQIFLRYASVIWLVTWLLEGRWLRRPRPLKENPMAIPFLLFGLWYAWKAVSGLWAADHAAWAGQMERYLTFACIIPVGIWGVNDCYDWRTIGRVFVVGCLVAVPAYLIFMRLLYLHPEWVPYLHVQEPWTHFPYWWTFLSENISQFKHRLFLSSVELTGMIVAVTVWKDKKIIPAVAIPVMLTLIVLTGSRQALLTATALGIAGLLYAFPRKFRWLYGMGLLFVGILIGGALIKFHPRMQSIDLTAVTRFRELSYEHDARLNIWGCALQTPSDYLAYGLGGGQSKGYIAANFTQSGFDELAHMQYHPHNQYLEELMEIGIPGLLLFLLAWIAIPLCAKKEHSRKFAVFFGLLYALNMLTDGMFAKFDGIALWVFCLVFVLLLQSDTQRE